MPTFQQLWDNHPINWSPSEPSPCKDAKGSPGFENQCAIRLGLALQGAGVNTDSVRGARCWHGHGKEHILRVLDLIPWIDANTGSIGCKKKTVSKKVTYMNYSGKKGIVYFQNFWGRNNQGDHIDLWDGQKVAKGDADYFERSQEVWFWEM